MRYKLELDFQFWRFFTFGLFAALVATALAVYSFKISEIPGAGIWNAVFLVLGILFVLSMFMFLRNYSKLRKILK